MRKSINQQSLDNIALLKEPELALLANNVTTTNSTISLPHAPGQKFPIRVYRPSRSKSDTLPIMMYFHSGYWSTGNADADELGCRAMIAHGNEIIIISLEYRLAPENPWNDILADAEHALKWLSQNAPAYGGDIKKGLYVGGATAGAHLAAIAAIRARDRHSEIKLSGMCLIVPTTLSWTNVERFPEEWKKLVTSHTDNAEAPLLSEKDFQRYVSILNVPDDEKTKGENFPVWADSRGLPPTYLAMDGPDPLRDEGYLYEMLLRKAGVQTRTDHYDMPNW